MFSRRRAAISPRPSTCRRSSLRTRFAVFGKRPNLDFVVQEPQLGTAHALQQAEASACGPGRERGPLSGDVPLLTSRNTCADLIETHHAAPAAATVVTAIVDRPVRLRPDRPHEGPHRQNRRGTRRIPRGAADSGDQRRHLRVRPAPLFDALRGHRVAERPGRVLPHGSDRDLSPAEAAGRNAWSTTPQEIRGINSRTELAEVSRIVRQTKERRTDGRRRHARRSGHNVHRPRRGDRRRHGDSSGVSSRAERASAPPAKSRRTCGSSIRKSPTTSRSTTSASSSVRALQRASSIGPFAHLRPETSVGEGAKIGNFVELKKTTLGPGSKVESPVLPRRCRRSAQKVNVGAGTITCNYDGANETPDGHRGRRVHRQRHAADCAGHGREGCVCWRRLVHHRGRACRRARHRARTADETSKAGKSAKKAARHGRAAEAPSEEKSTVMCGIIGYIGSKPWCRS